MLEPWADQRPQRKPLPLPPTTSLPPPTASRPADPISLWLRFNSFKYLHRQKAITLDAAPGWRL